MLVLVPSLSDTKPRPILHQRLNLAQLAPYLISDPHQAFQLDYVH